MALNKTKCQGWVNPSSIFTGPIILSLSSYYSPSGATSLVTLFGENFFSYSTILFATYNPTVYFINSNSLQFYVPPSLTPGIYPIQVFNDSYGSNVVMYTLDNSSGYWLLQPDNSIINTNAGGITITGETNAEEIIVQNNINLSGIPNINYIQFPDNSQQFTAYNPLIGEIKMFAGTFVPPNYLSCDGSSLNIIDYPQLFNVIQKTYGGTATTFNLPNLQARFPAGASNISNMTIPVDSVDSITGGNKTMNTNQVGGHTHTFVGDSQTVSALNNVPIVSTISVNRSGLGNDGGSDQVVINVNSNAIGIGAITVTSTPTGNISNNIASPTDLLPPFTVVQYIICYK